MASQNKRSWKLQEFVAHNANVNCLALGHKSGRVMVTGGDDMKVNLWAIGKQSLFMSLSGHTTPIDCVQFNHVEELVCAGSRAGAIKLWDLEAAKLVRTLTGHKDSIRCVDFNPCGDFLASGSSDCSIKLWDCRKKGCIFTYPGHKARVNSVKFSPDGYWVATGGDDCVIKIWDLRVGRVLKEFTDHVNSVTCVEFHPQDFLLVSGSTDRSVHFYDLENFNLVGSERDLGAVRCLWFNPDGECLFTGVRDYVKVVGWEPSRLYDSVPVNWGRICDISTAQNQLVGASFHLTNVLIYVVDLKKVAPLGGGGSTGLNVGGVSTSSTGGGGNTSLGDTSSPFTPNTSLRKSFSKADRPVDLKNRLSNGSGLNGKTIEESTSGTDPEEESSCGADITNIKDYNEIFKAARALNRTPPPDPFLEPEEKTKIEQYFIDPTAPQILAEFNDHHNIEALSLDHTVNYCQASPPPSTTSLPMSPNSYARSKSNLDTVYSNRAKLASVLNKDKDKTTVASNRYHNHLQRQASCKDGANNEGLQQKVANSIRHCTSEANLSTVIKGGGTNRSSSRKNSFSRIHPNTRTNNNTNNNTLTSGSVPNVSKIPRNNNNMLSDNNKQQQQRQQVTQSMDVVYITTTGGRGERIARANSDGGRVVDSGGGMERNSSVEEEDETIVPVSIDRPVGLEMDDFLPRSQQIYESHRERPTMSEAEVVGAVMRGHDAMMTLLSTRQRYLKMTLAQHRSKDSKAAVEMAVSLNDNAVLVDLLGVYNHKYSLWNLDLCAMLLPKIQELIQSKYETYITTGCDSIKLILRYFGSVIKSNVHSPVGGFGVDIPREERYRKSVKCQESFDVIRSIILKKQSVNGNIGHTFKEVYTLIKNTLE